MKLFCSFTFCVLLPFLILGQKVAINGVVSLHNNNPQTKNIQYVKGIKITSNYSVPTITDKDGKFKLIFDKSETSRFIIIEVETKDFEVVNKRILKTFISNQDKQLNLFLSPIGALQKAQTQLLDISGKALATKYDTLMAQISKADRNSEKLIDRLGQQFDQEIIFGFEAKNLLTGQIALLKKYLPETAKQLATVHLSFSSSLYIEAITLYKTGQLDRAIEKLASGNLDVATEELLRNLANTEDNTHKYSQLENRLEQIIDSYYLQANIYKLSFNYLKAIEAYEKLLLLAEKRKGRLSEKLAEVHRDLGSLYFQVNEHEKSLEQFSKQIFQVNNMADISAVDRISANDNFSSYLYLSEGFSKTTKAPDRAVRVEEDELLSVRNPNNLNLAFSYDESVYKMFSELTRKVSPEVLNEIELSPQHLQSIYAKKTVFLADRGECIKAGVYRNRILEIQGKEIDRSETNREIAFCYYNVYAYEKALEYFRLIYQADDPYLCYYTSLCHLKLNQLEEAKKTIDDFENNSSFESLKNWLWSLYYTQTNSIEEALDYLEKVIEEDQSKETRENIITQGLLDSLRGEARYKEMMKKFQPQLEK